MTSGKVRGFICQVPPHFPGVKRDWLELLPPEPAFDKFAFANKVTSSSISPDS